MSVRSESCSSDEADCIDNYSAPEKSDQEFEAELQELKRRLEQSCAQKIASHAKKLRPNFEETWIVKLKMQLKVKEKTSPSSGQSATAPAGSAHGRSKH